MSNAESRTRTCVLPLALGNLIAPRTVFLLALTYVCLGFAVPTSGLASWTDPITLTSPRVAADSSTVAVSANGKSVVAWRECRNKLPKSICVPAPNYRVRAMVRSAAEPLTKPITLSTPRLRPGAHSPQVVVDSRGNAVVVWESWAVGRPGKSYIEAATYNEISARWQNYILSAGQPPAKSPHVATDPISEFSVATWTKYLPNGGSKIQASTKVSASSGSWSRPVDVEKSEQLLGDPKVSVADAGSASIVWHSGSTDVVYAADLAGGSWRVGKLSDPNREAYAPQIDLDASGRGVAAWRVANPREGGGGNTTLTYASYRAADSTWSEPEKIADGKGELAVGRSGRAALLYEEGQGGASDSTKVITRKVGEAWAQPTIFEDSYSAAEDIAIDSDGNILALWKFYDANGGRTKIRTSVNDVVTNRWGLVEEIKRDSDIQYPDIGGPIQPFVSIEKGAATAVWWQRISVPFDYDNDTKVVRAADLKTE